MFKKAKKKKLNLLPKTAYRLSASSHRSVIRLPRPSTTYPNGSIDSTLGDSSVSNKRTATPRIALTKFHATTELLWKTVQTLHAIDDEFLQKRVLIVNNLPRLERMKTLFRTDSRRAERSSEGWKS